MAVLRVSAVRHRRARPPRGARARPVRAEPSAAGTPPPLGRYLDGWMDGRTGGWRSVGGRAPARSVPVPPFSGGAARPANGGRRRPRPCVGTGDGGAAPARGRPGGERRAAREGARRPRSGYGSEGREGSEGKWR